MNFLPIAKHLEPLQGGKIPVEILVRSKDAEQNQKHWDKCIEVIKGAGVGQTSENRKNYIAKLPIEESRHYCERYIDWTVRRRVEESLQRKRKGFRRG